MKVKIKKLIILGVAALLVFAGAYYLYWSYHPPVCIMRAVSNTADVPEGERYREVIMVASSSQLGIPEAESVKENFRELADWNNEADMEIHSYTDVAAPYHITVSGEVKGGKTTLRYEGYLTTPDGERIEYKNERTFDFVLVPDDELFNNNRL